MYTHTQSLSHANFSERNSALPPIQSSASAAGLHLWNTGTHTLNCARVYWLLRYLPDMQGFFSLQETIVYQTVMLPHFTYFYKGFVLPEHGNTLRSSFFTSVYYPSISHLLFWRWAADRVEKSCGWQLHCQYSAVSWEETKCISQCGGNVTVLVIRAFKLAALPKHCQTLCERGEILTVLSPLIVGA